MPPVGIRLVISTIDSEESARKLADQLVNERLAACVTVDGPSTSVYRWEGEVVEDREWTLLAKTRDDRVGAVIRFLEQNHPYDCPEILSLSVDEAGADYAQWVKEQVD